MAKKNYEIRAFRDALETYLAAQGWLGLEFRENFKSEKTITVPLVAVRFLPTNKKSLQLGGKGGEDLLRRVVQVDCYMETEDRAGAINDDVMDFLDLTTIIIKDPDNNILGTLICNDTESIYSDVLSPILTDPKVKRWRGVIRATMETHYYAP